MLENYSYIIKALLNLSIAIFLILFVLVFFKWVEAFLLTKNRSWIKPLIFKNNEIISSDRIVIFIHSTIKFLKWISIVFILYLSVPFVLHELPATRSYAIVLLNSIRSMFSIIIDGIFNYIPSLFFIGIVIFLTRSLVRFLKFIFYKIENGVIVIDGFYPEWASTTFYLVRFISYIFALVIIYPYLPGSGSKVLEGVTVFLGLVVSLGSGSAISNIIAGVMISYMRPFQKGDYIKIGSAMGHVLEKGLIVTKIMTFKNEEVSIPNTQVLSSQIYNYSAQAEKGELVIYTDVTVCYSIEWRVAYDLMYEAAKRCEHLNHSKAPFILQTQLGDKNITYQLNVYTEYADRIPAIKSELHLNLQEVFKNNGIDMISPDYLVIKDETSSNSR